MNYYQEVRQFKRALIETALREHEGNRTRAAKALGLSREYLYRLMKDLAVNVPPVGKRPERGGDG